MGGVSRVGGPRWGVDPLYLVSLLRGLGASVWPAGRGTRRAENRAQVPIRSVPRLRRDAQGRPRCVACHLCVAACPSGCIRIEAGPSPWGDRLRLPRRFEIDALRCLFCGYCVHACPVDAIVMGNSLGLVCEERQGLVLTQEQLLLE